MSSLHSHGKRNKFGVRIDPTGKQERTVCGELYDSKLEARFAATLELLKNATLDRDRVKWIERQVSIALEVNGRLICRYRIDYRVTYADGHRVYFEVKGMPTPEWKIKHALFLALYPDERIQVVTNVRA